MKSSLYPPKLTLISSSDVHPLVEYNRSRLICLEIAGSRPRIQIPVQIFDRVEPGMVSVCVHACMRACVRACVCACMRACVRACVYICMCIHKIICAYTCVWIVYNI